MRPASRTRTFRVFKPLLRQCLTDHGVGVAVAWFYMPMALPLLDTVPARAVVYHCIDELSAFDFAPPQLLQLEAERLQHADLVLTATAGCSSTPTARTSFISTVRTSSSTCLDSRSGAGTSTACWPMWTDNTMRGVCASVRLSDRAPAH